MGSMACGDATPTTMTAESCSSVPADPEIPKALEEASRDSRSECRKSASTETPCVPIGRKLTHTVGEEILRAVQLDDALSGFGQYLSGTITGGKGEDVDAQPGFELSRKVRHIDEFWSHDWASPRWRKTIALLCLYNSGPALVATLLVCLAVTVLEATQLLGPGLRYDDVMDLGGTSVEVQQVLHPLVICPLLGLFALLFWQRLRGRLLRPRFVFFDKICIHQTNAEAKAQAILSLSGFLRSSQRLVILWTPRYLTRLWCVYEIASWIYLGKDFRCSVTFVPVSLSFGILLTAGAVSLAYLMSALFLISSTSSDFLYGVVGIMMVGLLGPMFFLREMVWELGHLKQQLKKFKVEEAECYCCSMRHVSEGGASISCDRVLVYQALAKWFPDEDAGGDFAHLEKFNHYVHEVVAPAVSSSLLGPWSRYKLCMLVTFPTVWYSARVVSFYRPLLEAGLSASIVALWGLDQVLYTFVLNPSCAMITLRLCSLSTRIGGEGSLAPGFRCFCLVTFVAFGTVLSYILMLLGLVLTENQDSPIPLACVLAFYSVLALLIFRFPWNP